MVPQPLSLTGVIVFKLNATSQLRALFLAPRALANSYATALAAKAVEYLAREVRRPRSQMLVRPTQLKGAR